MDDDGLGWGGGDVKVLCVVCVFFESVFDFCDGGWGWFGKFDRDVFGMVVDDGDMGVCGGDVDLFGCVEVKCFVVGCDVVEDFVGFLFDFVFFVIDEGDDVVYDI